MQQNQTYEEMIRKMFPNIDTVTSVPKMTPYQPEDNIGEIQTPPTTTVTTTAPTSSAPNASKLLFKELLEYKTTRCQDPNCQFNPRTTVANNQYLEAELQCHGYHHAKDFRRTPIKDMKTFTGEFEYQANYYKDGRCPLAKDKYSQNFFESLYHPLYYKQFACKRSFCDKTKYCPYFHSEREKIEWELIFEQNLKVNRKVFLSTKTRQTQDSGYKTPGSIGSGDEDNTVRSPLTSSSRGFVSKGAAFENRPTFQPADDIFKPFQYNYGNNYQNFLNYGKPATPLFATPF